MVHSVIITCLYCHNWPSGTVIRTAAPRYAYTWQLCPETAAVVEHYRRAHDPCSSDINRGAGVTYPFYPALHLLPLVLPFERSSAGRAYCDLAPPPLRCTPVLGLSALWLLPLHRRWSSSSLVHRSGRSVLLRNLTVIPPPPCITPVSSCLLLFLYALCIFLVVIFLA
jgi:hypothetical protein